MVASLLSHSSGTSARISNLESRVSMTQPPVAERKPVTVVRHGETFTDDYAWLRDRDDPAVRGYLEAENAWAATVLAPTAGLQQQLYDEMLGRIRQTDVSVPYRKGEWWYFTRTEEGQQYPIHCRRRGGPDHGEEVVLLDVNVLAEGKPYVAVGGMRVSDDGWLLAYSTDETGFRQYTLRVIDLRTGDHLPTRRERVTAFAWDADDRTLWYTVEHPDTKRSYQAWQHVLGADGDRLVHEEADETMNLEVGRSLSREWLFLASGSHTTSEVRVRRAGSASEAGWRVLLPRVPEREYSVAHHGGHFHVRINDTGRNFRLVRLAVDGGTLEAAEEVVPHRPDVMIEGHELFAGHLVVHEREGGLPQIAIHDLATGERHRITFPEPSYECHPGANAEFDTTEYRFGYQSLVTPVSVYSWHMVTRERQLLKQREVLGGFERSDYVSERIEATAADGTRVPVSLIRRRDTPVDGTAPCLLHGYGSYGYSYPISFSSNQLSLLDRGVVAAIAHIRGGGEFGKPWHDAGRMARKATTFTDFLAAADALAAGRHAAADRLAIEGGSAGGLLMGAVVNLAPTRFAAVVSQVPFVDVLNTMSDETLPLTVGEYEEWGHPEVPEQFAWMRGYDPYTNLRPGPYPPMLVRTSLNDSQVMYWEPAKYVARIRAMRSDDAPLLLVTNMGAGHGGASGRYDRLREIAMDYAFLLATLGVVPVALSSPAPAATRPESVPS
jgi:oligopeptidase B